jgi:hypothetical protein
MGRAWGVGWVKRMLTNPFEDEDENGALCEALSWLLGCREHGTE